MQRGWSPRQIYEVMYRVRLIVNTKRNKRYHRQILIKEKNALTQVVRTFRGTPSQHSYRTTEGVTLHYSKDLSYLQGK